MDHTTKKNDAIAIILSSSDEYCIYLPVILKSIHEESSKNYCYHFYILDSGITQSSKHVINAYIANYENFSIEYIDVQYFIEKYKNLWYVTGHFSVATYIRFFIPDLVPKLDKVLYLDVDLLVRGDISELYAIDIGDCAIGACVDACYERETYYNKNNLVIYNKTVVCLPDDYKVFNAGVLLINLKKWRELNITEKFIQKLSDIKTPRVLDQCILNSVFCNGQVYYLPAEWNYQWHADLTEIQYPTSSTKMNEVIEAYRFAKNNLKIIHYTTQTKPWNIYANKAVFAYTLEEELASLWWVCARDTPFYEKIILENIKKISNFFVEKDCGKKQSFFGLIKVVQAQDKKRYYFLGLRCIKVVNNNYCKRIYLFGIPIYSRTK